MITLKFKRLFDQATIPTKKFPSDAGWDLCSIEDVAIAPHTQYMVRTGVQLAGVDVTNLPPETSLVFQAWSRSGMDSKKGLHVGAGVIDQNFRGELLVLLKNMSNQTQHIVPTDKIAQLVPVLIPDSQVEEVLEVEDTDRGEQGGIMSYHKEVSNVQVDTTTIL